MGNKKKICALCTLAAGIFLLSACEGDKEKETASEYSEQSDYTVAQIAESEDGYYVWGMSESLWGDNQIFFLDKETDQFVPLCNKPDCTHDSEECNSYYTGMGFAEEGKDGFDAHYLQYYEGNLYAVGCDVDGYFSLYRIAADGSGTWELSTKLYRTDFIAGEGSYMSPTVLIYQGYVYYTDSEQTYQKLSRKALGGEKEEIVFSGTEEDGLTAETYRFKECDGALYFQVYCYTEDDETKSVKNGLYRCTGNDVACELVKEDLVVPYSVRDGWVYYGDETGLCRYSIENGDTEVIVNEAMNVPYLTLTGEYIAVYDTFGDKSLTLYDYDGNEVAQTINEKQSECYGGSSQMLFGAYIDDETDLSLCCLNLRNIESGIAWEKLETMSDEVKELQQK